MASGSVRLEPQFVTRDTETSLALNVPKTDTRTTRPVQAGKYNQEKPLGIAEEIHPTHCNVGAHPIQMTGI